MRITVDEEDVSRWLRKIEELVEENRRLKQQMEWERLQAEALGVYVRKRLKEIENENQHLSPRG